jgi:cytochrome P450
MQTAAALAWPHLALIAYPDKQKKCQEELDAVIGHARMPTFEDMDNLPYLKATVREALRWRAVTPLGRFFYVSGVSIA